MMRHVRWLCRITFPHLSSTNPIAVLSQHDIEGVFEGPEADVEEDLAGGSLGDGVGEGADYLGGMTDGSSVVGVGSEDLIAAEADKDMLLRGCGQVVYECSPLWKGWILLHGWKAGAAVSKP